MQSPEVPPAEPTAVVAVTGFTGAEMVEMRRGLVQRLTVAQSNLRDKRNKDDILDWYAIYETCWSAYRKLTQALAPSVEPPCDDEFEYLSRPVAKD